MNSTVADHKILDETSRRLGLNSVGAQLVSYSSRAVWHLPQEGVAVLITKSASRTLTDVNGEARAVGAAIDAGVRTPPVMGGPLILNSGQTALVYRWLERATESPEHSWTETVAQAARLAHARTDGLPSLRMVLGATEAEIQQILGRGLAEQFRRHWHAATATVSRLFDTRPAVLCHGDLHPKNLLTDSSGRCWLIDFEYASLAPPEWDPAKILILANRFGEPSEPENLLEAWGKKIDEERLNYCVTAQEALLVGWLAIMALHGTTGAASEARHRASTLGNPNSPGWRHL